MTVSMVVLLAKSRVTLKLIPTLRLRISKIREEIFADLKWQK